MNKAEKKKIEKRKQIFALSIAITCGIIAFFVLMHLSGIDMGKTLKLVLQLLGVTAVIVLLYIIPSIYFDNRYKLVNKITKVKISNVVNEDENIKVTKDNLIFKYSPTIRFKYLLPRFFLKLTGTGKKNAEKIGKDNPGYNIRGIKQLSKSEAKVLIDKIDALSEDDSSNIVVKTKEYEKYVNEEDVNAVLKEFSSIRIFNYEKKKRSKVSLNEEEE